jgi:hypothetical protein
MIRSCQQGKELKRDMLFGTITGNLKGLEKPRRSLSTEGEISAGRGKQKAEVFFGGDLLRRNERPEAEGGNLLAPTNSHRGTSIG